MADGKMPQFLNFGPPSRSSSPSRDFLANLGVVLGLSQGMQLPIGIKLTPADSKYTEVSRGRWPGRGLLYSFVAHEVAIFALLVIPSKFLPSERRFREVERWLPLDAKLTYSLPEIGGGHEGGGHARGDWCIPGRNPSSRIHPIRRTAFRPSFSRIW
ncbi:MAG: hypothetical protein LAN62_11505 [Acidobacteriia bacterium]|nr:hypothetical protein [Terriglobia bacterium]